MEAVWRAWSGPRPRRVARFLALAGCGTLFLAAAATVQVVYSIRVPYALFGAACAVGAPLVVDGWRTAPAWVRATALSLFAVYLAATIAGTGDTLGTARGGSHRDLAYLVDLGVGLASVGLVMGLWRDAPSGPAVRALAIGASLAALYAIYQWPARRFGLPLDDVNNTLDSNGVTSGHFQGRGLLGWERVRGTFQEPHYLAAFLAALLPFSVLAAWTTRRRLLAAGVAAVAVAMILTVSAPAWGSLSIGAAAAAALFAIGRGWTGAAAATAAAAVALAVAGPLVGTSPHALASVTGRSDSELLTSSNVRFDAWRDAARIWASRPVLGFGPGQSSVQLARVEIAAERRSRTKLSSAQGLWAAALVDAGALGFGAWLLFLGGVLVVGARGLFRDPTPLRAAAFAAGVSIVVSSEVAGDRLDTVAWVLIGLLLASAARAESSRHAGHAGHEADGAADQRAAQRPRTAG